MKIEKKRGQTEAMKPKRNPSAWFYAGVLVQAFTKSEVRALLKKTFGRLPVGAQILRISD